MGIYLLGDKCNIRFNRYTMSIWCVEVMSVECPKERNRCVFDYECLAREHVFTYGG